MHIEPLEPRMAPASVLLYTDIDGDKVKITSSSGDLTGSATLDNGQLELLDLTDSSFNGADIIFKVTKAGAGDGFANVGRIDGGLNNLGVVAVQGDLAQIDTGSGTAGAPALVSLVVRSMGVFGLATQGGTGDLESTISGALGGLTVTGAVHASIRAAGGAFATIGVVKIGGSLIGSDEGGGRIFSEGDAGTVKIGGDVRGGLSSFSGGIETGGSLRSVIIRGSLIGGRGDRTGAIVATTDIGSVKIRGDMEGSIGLAGGEILAGAKLGDVTVGGSLLGSSGPVTASIIGSTGIGTVRIGGDVHGGSGNSSGSLFSGGNFDALTIGGSLSGGEGSGNIFSIGDLGVAKIGGDMLGVSIFGTNTIDASGCVESERRIGKIVIGGSIISGIDTSSGVLTRNASIQAGDDIGALKVNGGLIGNGNPDGFSPVIISARGQTLPTAGTDLAIGKISIGGSVEHALVLAGYEVRADVSNTSAKASNGNAQIGPVRVGGDWIASSLVAGVKDTGNNGFGNSDDTVIAGGTIARIASIVIGGAVAGTNANGDHFGFVARQIGTFQSLGFIAPLSSGPNTPIELSQVTDDVTIREI